MWCMDSYGKFMELAMKPKETGAYLREPVFYFKDMVEDLPAQLDKMNELWQEFIWHPIYRTLILLIFLFDTHKSLFEKECLHILLFNDFNALFICTLCCASPLCSHLDF